MKTRQKTSLDVTIKVGILGALAAVLHMLDFPLPFLAPSFYALDFSEIIVLLGGFSLGPWAAVGIEAVKIVIKLLLKGTSTMYVGDLANFLMGCALVLPAIFLYQKVHNRKGAAAGMALGTVLMTLVGCILNAYVLIPLYAKLFMPMDAILSAGADVNGAIHSVSTLVWIAVAPFNLVKGTFVSFVTGLVYKKVSPLLKRNILR